MKNKTILITGSGTLSQALTKEILKQSPKTIRIISRTQKSLEAFPIKDKRLRLWQKDIKDLNSLIKCFNGVDYLIHTAAEKRINFCESNPEESYRVNVEGTLNVCYASAIAKVKKVLFISTDKAFDPTTYYGYTKAMGEQLAINYNNETNKKTRYSAVRYGNVWKSAGSVIELWEKQGVKTITNPDMTRFFMTVDMAVQLVLTSLKKMKGGEIFCCRMKAIKIGELVKGLYPSAQTKVIGLRSKEKLHEGLFEGYYSNDHVLNFKEFMVYLQGKFNKKEVINL
jgi:UDP-N-acetylglucosamine 4,6-dehydratase